MTTRINPRTVRLALLFALAVLLLPLLASNALAGEVFRSNVIFQFVSDRGHMLQVSIAFVALGIFLLWWKH